MIITKLKQNNFRNLKPTEIEFDQNVTIFIGDNGQGKTNILEALYLSLNGKSFRPAKTEHFVNKNENLGFIEISLQNNSLKENVKIELANKAKKSFLNGKKVSTNKILSKFPTVLFSPESLAAIKEGPELRRALIDELLITHNSKNIDLINDFQKCLKTRNKLLKDHLAEKISENEFHDVLSSLDQTYLPLAAKLSLARVSALKDLEKDFVLATKNILKIDDVDISVDYLVSGDSARLWSEKELYYALLNRHEELSSAEKESGTTLIGPQRHDIQFLFDQVDARYYCSQGQQRALILAFKMAQIMYHCRVHKSYPLLLLDDVLSELDPEKRNRLITFLNQLNAQIVLTTTDLDFQLDFEKEKLTILKVSQGEIQEYGE